jgi:hypothetical protein
MTLDNLEQVSRARYHMDLLKKVAWYPKFALVRLLAEALEDLNFETRFL